MGDIDAATFIRAARSRIAASGIRGLSLRTVAQDAGSSVGSLSYRIGDKRALIAHLIDDERREFDRMAHAWRKRAGQLDLAVPEVLAHFVTAWLDEAATVRREAALAGCELLLEATIDPAGYRGTGDLLDDEDRFWRGVLAPGYRAISDIFGSAIAAYCRDEMPFSIALGGNADYRLLRAATVQRLAEGLAGSATGLARSFEALVAACGDTSAAVALPVDLPAGSKKAELAAHIADLMAEQGVASVTHRLVAARAGVPNSSVAHHFRTGEDLLHAGLGAQILRMRQELQLGALPDAQANLGMMLMRSTHAVALAAARDPAFVPFALDMRRRRAENVHLAVGQAIGGVHGLDRAAAQAATMTYIGSGLAITAGGGADGSILIGSAQLVRLRQSCSFAE
ncbi:TetR family transcriptional regulator [Novosphingobium album (ex Liu et al. 2023)]|uniref:TetR family transcriptional regulator n=1 Tax=Novosphingobium album (ex Liu et al. 2023) TaxID=3031130 RepID=A0ABT5WPR3_9SPHN|nr:TetR family transcriptional regulator [Novosphingobium album (ex Liu et al. 2023)]MDE8652027.1 TetR family transcriptional regulator [Novosphingobium album (ex Liu et al. 2023)]